MNQAASAAEPSFAVAGIEGAQRYLIGTWEIEGRNGPQGHRTFLAHPGPDRFLLLQQSPQGIVTPMIWNISESIDGMKRLSLGIRDPAQGAQTRNEYFLPQSQNLFLGYRKLPRYNRQADSAVASQMKALSAKQVNDYTVEAFLPGWWNRTPARAKAESWIITRKRARNSADFGYSYKDFEAGGSFQVIQGRWRAASTATELAAELYDYRSKKTLRLSNIRKISKDGFVADFNGVRSEFLAWGK